MTSEERNDDVLAKSNDSEPSSKQEGFVGQTILLKSGLSGSFSYPHWRGPPSLLTYTNQNDTSGDINPSAPSNDRLSYASNKRDLILTNASVNDSGEYRCSYAGLGEHSIILEVKEKTTSTPPDDDNTGEIVGGVLGGVAGVCVCVVGGYFIWKWMNRAGP